jgi:hypothetical protein
MAENPLISRIVALLASEAAERQIAAAIVLGELGASDADVIAALGRAADAGIPPVQRHAMDALARLAGGAAGAAKRILPVALGALGSKDEVVRGTAVDAVIACGDLAVGPVRERLRALAAAPAPADAAERRALEQVLGRVGGKTAFVALLAGLDNGDAEAAREAALAVRQRVKEATARERAAYVAEVLKRLGKPKASSPAATAGALKVLGYLEDPAAVPKLLAFAADKRQPANVREEAIVALRFTSRGKASGRAATALLDLADKSPIELARPALFTLASLQIPPTAVARLKKITLGAEPERAMLALERLAQIAAPAAADALAAVLTSTADRVRAEAAAGALGQRPDGGVVALAKALAATRDPERAALLARLLRPRAKALAAGSAAEKKLAKSVAADAVARIGRGETADALLPLARELDPGATAAGLRAHAAKLAKAKQPERALALLRLVARAADATPGDGYALASAELRAGRRDEAMTVAGQLLDRGFDLAAALRRDRALTPEQRYQIGFALAEQRHPAGEEVLSDLARTGRSKVATMARAKLKSAGYV